MKLPAWGLSGSSQCFGLLLSLLRQSCDLKSLSWQVRLGWKGAKMMNNIELLDFTSEALALWTLHPRGWEGVYAERSEESGSMKAGSTH